MLQFKIHILGRIGGENQKKRNYDQRGSEEKQEILLVSCFSEEPSLTAYYVALSTHCVEYLYCEMEFVCLVIPVNPVELASLCLQCLLTLDL